MSTNFRPLTNIRACQFFDGRLEEFVYEDLDRSRFALDRFSVNERKQRCGNIQSGIPADVLFGATAGVATSAGRGFGSRGDGATRW